MDLVTQSQPHHCRQADPRGWVGLGSFRARTVANDPFGSQKEKHEVQGSCGSGGGLMKNLLVKGQACRVRFTVHPSRLAFYNPQMRFVTEPGAFTFSIGISSADMRAEQTVKLEGQVVEYLQ